MHSYYSFCIRGNTPHIHVAVKGTSLNTVNVICFFIVCIPVIYMHSYYSCCTRGNKPHIHLAFKGTSLDAGSVICFFS